MPSTTLMGYKFAITCVRIHDYVQTPLESQKRRNIARKDAMKPIFEIHPDNIYYEQD